MPFKPQAIYRHKSLRGISNRWRFEAPDHELQLRAPAPPTSLEQTDERNDHVRSTPIATKKIIPGSLTTRLLSDAVVERFDFGVDDPQGAFAAHTVLAGCGGLTSRYCLDELGDDDAAFLINRRMGHTVVRRSRTPNTGSAQR